MKARLIRTEEVAERTAAFTFEIEDAGFAFSPGQTCDFSLPQPKYEDALGSMRTFSIASSPGDLPRIVVATRLTGSAFKRSLVEAAPGTVVDVDGPYGSFTLHRNLARPGVLLAGGIGITPFRSIIKDVVERQAPRDVTLFYSNRSAAAAPFVPDLERWAAADPRFRLVATLTNADPAQPWSHQTGRLDAAWVGREIADRQNAVFYIAGPARFVTGIRGVLAEVGADPDDVRFEEFPGY